MLNLKKLINKYMEKEEILETINETVVETKQTEVNMEARKIIVSYNTTKEFNNAEDAYKFAGEVGGQVSH